MTIAKLDILTKVNKICKRKETDIDGILLEALREISIRIGAVTDLATGNTVANQEYVSAPDDLAGLLIHSFYTLPAGSTQTKEKPMKSLTWIQHKTGNRDGYCLYKDRIYIRPIPLLSTDVYYCEYSKLDDDVDNIEHPDEFQPAIIRLTASLLYEEYERYDEVQNQITLYERKLAQLSGYRPTAPVVQFPSQEY